MNEEEIKDLILKFGKKKSRHGDDRIGRGWLQGVRIARESDFIHASFLYNYDEDPFEDTVSTIVYFRGALLFDMKGTLLAKRLQYVRKEWDGQVRLNLRSVAFKFTKN